MKPLSQRQTEFKHRLWEEAGKPTDPKTINQLKLFCEYWFEINYNGRKMRFEKEKTFCFKRRWNTWKRNAENWSKPIEKKDRLPDYFNKTLWQRLPPDKVQEYKAHLINLGWQYFTSQAGNHWLSPDKKRHWLS